jgi:DMSO/TMAO reductase YedYZ molybdopterin-dependent catalytic subunit
MIVRSEAPEVIEFPFAELDGLVTPSEKFYVRDHFDRPSIDLATWRLRVEGCDSKLFELSYEEIVSMPSVTVLATLECAGNGRQFLVPPPQGVQWHLGGIGTAEWLGVPLSAILERAGMPAHASEVIFRGADCGHVESDEKPAPVGLMHFERSVPVRKAMDDVIVAYKMNGSDLTPAHGFPLRVIVPGWYAVASVKWLTAITVSDHPFTGYYQSLDYTFCSRESGEAVRVPISKLRVKAEIARPQPNEVIASDHDYEIFGAAWSGESQITRVEVSTDRGGTWTDAALLGAGVRNAWRLWSYNWRTPSTPQSATLTARATDDQGNTQPVKHDPDYADYMIHFCLPIPVRIE